MMSLSFFSFCIFIYSVVQFFPITWIKTSLIIQILIGFLVSELLWPSIFPWSIDTNQNNRSIADISNVALVYIMFLSGVLARFNAPKNLKSNVISLVLASTVVPASVAFLAFTYFEPISGLFNTSNSISAVLFFVCVFCVTSLPFITAIFEETGFLETKFASIVLASSSIQDVLLWSMLALAIMINSHEMYFFMFDTWDYLSVIFLCLTVVFIVKASGSLSFAEITEPRILLLAPLMSFVVNDFLGVGLAVSAFMLGSIIGRRDVSNANVNFNLLASN